MQIDDGGNASFFAVVDKSLAMQRDMIKKGAARKAEQKKQAEKKQAQKAAEEKSEQKRAEKEKDLVTVSASSIDELLRKIDDILFEARSDYAQTEEEKKVGQNFNFWC